MLERSIRTLDKIQSFACLPYGWHYGSGEPLSPQTIGYAIAWLRALVEINLVDNDAFPGVDGDVLITVYLDGGNMDFTINKLGEASLIVERGLDEICSFPAFSLSRVRELISAAMAALWNTSVFSIQNTSTAVWVGSKALLSRTLLTVEGHRFSNSIAASKAQAMYVPTSNASIQTLGVIQQSTGSLKQMSSRKEAA